MEMNFEAEQSLNQDDVDTGSCSSSDDEWDTDVEDNNDLDSDSLPIEQIYLRTCEELRAPPITRVTKQIKTDMIDLKHYGILDKGAKALAKTMGKNVTVATLNLHDNGIKKLGAIEIARMLETNCFIVKLDLSNNNIGQEGVVALAKMLRGNVTLRDLNLSNNKLLDEDIALLCDVLSTHRHLTCLRLSGNDLGDKASTMIGLALKSNEVLECLDLSWNRILGKGATALAVGCKEMFSLKELNLSWNGLSDDGAKGIRAVLEKDDCSLKILDITSISIGTTGAGHIAKGLRKNTSLKTLRVGKNPFMSTGALAIFKGLLKNPQNCLEELLLENIAFDKECEEALGELLEIQPNFSCKWDVIIKGGHARTSDETGEASPLEKFIQFMRNRGLRMVDMYRSLAKGDVLREDKFVRGLKSFNAQMTDKELRELFNTLDLNGDKEMSFREFSSILNFKIREREMPRREYNYCRKKNLSSD